MEIKELINWNNLQQLKSKIKMLRIANLKSIGLNWKILPIRHLSCLVPKGLNDIMKLSIFDFLFQLTILPK